MLSYPTFTSFFINEVGQTLLIAGFAKVALTAINATIATTSLIKTYWPEREISARQLA